MLYYVLVMHDAGWCGVIRLKMYRLKVEGNIYYKQEVLSGRISEVNTDTWEREK